MMLNSVETENRPIHPESNEAQQNRPDPEIEQIRNLLFGDIQKNNADRLSAIERRLAVIEADLPKQLNRLQEQIAQLATSTEASQRTMMLEIGKSISALGEQLTKLSSD